MMTLYGIYHCWDTDGGYGDAIGQEQLIAITDSEDVASEYVKKWSKEHLYDTPYAELSCGILRYEELPELITDTSRAPHEIDEHLGWAFDENDPRYKSEYDFVNEDEDK